MEAGLKETRGRAKQRIHSDILVLAAFIGIYCRRKHGDRPRSPAEAKGPLADYLGEVEETFCADCRKLLFHAAGKRMLCPYDPKPRCKKCPTHCYAGDFRERIREVMRFSGRELLKRGRLDLAYKYFF